MKPLFHEIYGCYFNLVASILKQARMGLSEQEMTKIISSEGFIETAFHLLPALIDGDWGFLSKKDDKYYSSLSNELKRPVSELEYAWLAAILNDKRIKLFVDDDILNHQLIKSIKPLFNQSDFISLDQHRDGDDYDNLEYIATFRLVLDACKKGLPLVITYDTGRGESYTRTFHPFKISYSELNDKFRLLCVAYRYKKQRFNKVTLNISRISKVSLSPSKHRVSNESMNEIFSNHRKRSQLLVEVSRERNTLERFLLHFASFDRRTQYDEEKDLYLCQLQYDVDDETELLIRVLSFGPTIKVLGPQSFVKSIKKRLDLQLKLFSFDC